jgi:hypothetical protein
MQSSFVSGWERALPIPKAFGNHSLSRYQVVGSTNTLYMGEKRCRMNRDLDAQPL